MRRVVPHLTAVRNRGAVPVRQPASGRSSADAGTPATARALAPVRPPATVRRLAVRALSGLLLAAVASCAPRPGGAAGTPSAAPAVPGSAVPEGSAAAHRDGTKTHRHIPGVGERLRSRVPAESRQAVVVYGEGEDSAESTVVLYRRTGDEDADAGWERVRSWPAHNGKKGWTLDHHEGDKRSPVGVFTLSDAGGVLPDPGAGLPYTRSDSFAAPRWWPRTHWHDFDYVIAIDYNRVKGTPPNDPTRPEGASKGGGIWLHLDHGSGTSACVSLPKSAMRHLLRTLDPAAHPVVVMGDRAGLAR